MTKEKIEGWAWRSKHGNTLIYAGKKPGLNNSSNPNRSCDMLINGVFVEMEVEKLVECNVEIEVKI